MKEMIVPNELIMVNMFCSNYLSIMHITKIRYPSNRLISAYIKNQHQP
jgi:hypothetical protein